jgi:hypothetical protein
MALRVDGAAMAAIDRFILLVRDLRRNERGLAVPTALMALIASFALASVAVISTVNVQQGTHRDHDSKEAIAAADAGANIAMLRLNRFLPSLSTSTPCIGPSGEEQKPSAEGWCPATAAEPVGGATYQYWISAFKSDGSLEVVSLGKSGSVSRRVSVAMDSNFEDPVFADEKLIGQDNIEFSGASPYIKTDIGTNGSIEPSGNSHPTICGNDRHGPGKEAPTPSCSGTKTEGEKSLPNLSAPENIENENSNCRLAANCPNRNDVDSYNKNRTSTKPWDSSHSIINVTSSATLTMGGRDYWVCGLFVNSGEIVMPVGSSVRIFIRTPEECKLAPGAIQVEITGSGKISSTGFNPQQGFFEVPGIYVLGSGEVRLEGNSSGNKELKNEFMLYAPESHIDIGGNASYNSLIAGKSLNIHGSVYVESNPRIKEPELFYESLFERTRYVECTGASVSPPNSSC